ncbi:MAG: C25 family cysteine peptidase [Candidatus Muiribacteriota bacterium]
MKKITVLLLFMFIFSMFIHAASVQKSVRSMRNGNVILDINIDIESLLSEKITIEDKSYVKLNMENSGVTLVKGEPELRTVSAFLAMPQGSTDVQIISSEFIEVENISIVPSKGSLNRNINPADVPYEFSDVYTKDEWYPAEQNIISNFENFILRDISGIRVEITPFMYNPKQNKLKIFNKLTIGVAVNATRNSSIRVSGNISSDFEKIYSDIFMNYRSPFQTRSGAINAPEEKKNLLIVAYDEFYQEILPLADWKKKTGFEVETVKYSEVANSADSLKNYFQQKYNEGNLCFVTLVGDIEHIPALKGKYEGANSDNMYMKLAGNDNIPDAFISRLSAKNVSDVKKMVKKTLDYEMAVSESTDWYKKALGIASNEGTPTDYERSDELTQSLKNKLGFTQVWECYAPKANSGGYTGGGSGYDPYDPYDPYNPWNPYNPGSGPGQLPPILWKSVAPRFDASNNSESKSIIFDAVNSGVSIINYIGHGSDYTWVTSGFNVSDIHSLNNFGKYPVIWDVACVNGALHRDECFAEAWMRAGTEDRPAGAIGIAAGSTNESWVPPCDWQGEIIHNQLGNRLNSTATVVNMYGLLKVAENYGATDRSEGNKLIEQKIYFGEGSVSLRTSSPKRITAEAVVVDNTILVAINGEVRNGLTVSAYNGALDEVSTSVSNSRGEVEIPYTGQTHITVYGNDIVPVVDLAIE